jgi:hypothetical protein
VREPRARAHRGVHRQRVLEAAGGGLPVARDVALLEERVDAVVVPGVRALVVAGGLRGRDQLVGDLVPLLDRVRAPRTRGKLRHRAPAGFG